MQKLITLWKMRSQRQRGRFVPHVISESELYRRMWGLLSYYERRKLAQELR